MQMCSIAASQSGAGATIFVCCSNSRFAARFRKCFEVTTSTVLVWSYASLIDRDQSGCREFPQIASPISKQYTIACTVSSHSVNNLTMAAAASSVADPEADIFHGHVGRLQRDGFSIFRAALSPAEVASTRATLLALHAKPERRDNVPGFVPLNSTVNLSNSNLEDTRLRPVLNLVPGYGHIWKIQTSKGRQNILRGL
jgi:hypothetical protein